MREELRREQAEVDLRYARLDELRRVTRDRLAEVRRSGPSGSPQNRSERDAFATLYEDRLAQLDGVEQRLTFGRLDLDDGQVRYIGRIGLSDDERESLLTDWRAPAAQPFYRATAVRPDGVVRRRHLVTSDRTVTGLEDELLDLEAADDSLGALSGEGALLAALATGRTGRMGDIVATIQAEQDAIIRSDLGGALVVQGGPGTGKTAVALHRAAYLLYAHRRVLERSGVLVIGPSRVFLRYIDQVLPSLGETGVVTATIGDLLPGVRAEGREPDAVARIKGLPVWRRIVARAVAQRERVPAHDQEVMLDGRRVVIRREDVAAAVARARRTGKPHNLARAGFVREMLGRLADQWLDDLGQPVSDEDRADVVEDLRRHRDVRVALNLAWFPISPLTLVEDLYAKPHRLEAAAPELSGAERAALRRAPGSAWTEADVPILDEAAELLGEDDQAQRAQEAATARRRAADLDYARQVLTSTGAGRGMVSAELLAGRFEATGPALTTAERAAADRSWTYGHVVVDEAQELSAMAWRMLLRRCPTRSMTIVGDVAQTSTAAGARSWGAMLDPALRGSWRMAELTVNYRTPAPVAQAAQRMARAAGLPVSPLTSAREAADSLRLRAVAPGGEVAAAVEAAAALAEEVGLTGDGGPGRIAVIAHQDRVDALHRALEGSSVAGLLRPDASLLDAPLSVITPREAKGLEFDAVVLVEPAEVAERTAGDLYVAMTRPTRVLAVVHSRPVPGVTGAGDGAGVGDGAGDLGPGPDGVGPGADGVVQ